MGDDEGGAPHGESIESPLDLGLGDGVQRGGGLIQNEDGGIFQEDAGDGHPLLLSAGQEGAPLAHIGLEALGHGHDVVINFRLLRGLHDLLLGGVGSAVADILKNGVGEEEHILLDDADVPVEGALGHIPHIKPVDADGARPHIVKAGDELAQGGLAAAGGAHDGHGLPGGNGEGDIAQHLGLLVVGEADTIHLDLTLHMGKFHGVFPVLHGGLGAHDLHEAVESREAGGKQLREVGQLAHGGDEGGDIQVEGEQIQIVHLPLHDEPAAHSDDDDIQTAQQKLHGAGEAGHGLVEVGPGVFKQLVCGGETGKLHVLVGEGPGGAEAGDAGLHLCVDVPGFLLAEDGGSGHLLAQYQHHDEERGDGQPQHQRQLPLDGGHDRQCAQNGQSRGQQILRAVVGKLGDLKQVGSQPVHEMSRAVFVIEVVAQGLHVAEEVGADVGLYPDAEGVTQIADQIVQPCAHHIAHRHDGHNGEEQAVHLPGQHFV